ncbi:TPA: hypothetical protein N0F65_005760 [Lagenidium giganteum]|uniref:Peptidase C1A papain C-terminal domain-containing protein n=1 Tax=Lagenidium giganteum TaxID=4803 RepID=A0AAV2YYB9_9STRA|nr:TPA: hypothetical protein N0F65_005760 [Lagenidium giganteum]
MGWKVTLAFLGHVGGQELAASALVSVWANASKMIVMGFSVSLCTLCGQAYGAQNFRLVGIWFQICLLCIAVLSAIITISFFFVDRILGFITDDQDVLRMANTYARWTAPTVFPLALSCALRQYFQAQEIVIPATIVSALSVLVCLGTNYFLVPPMGLVGAALADTVASTFQPLAMVGYACWWKGYHKKTWFDWELRECLEQERQPLQAASERILFNVWYIIFGVYWGFGLPTMMRCANFLGANNPSAAKHSVRVGLALGSAATAVCVLGVFVWRQPIAQCFTGDVDVILAIEVAIPVFCVAVFMSGLHIIVAAALDATALMTVLVVIIVVGSWVVTLPLSYVFSVVLDASAANLRSNTRIPMAHHRRFLQEVDEIEKQLDQWLNSDAGKEAQEQGFVQMGIMDENAKQDRLERFFLTKLGIDQAQDANPDAVFSLDTPFSLMTDDEFAAFLGNSYNNMGGLTNLNITVEDPHEDEFDGFNVLGASKDWSTSSSCVAPVKNQGACGSCWAFASVGSLESAHCIKTQKLTLLSEQEVTSCEKQSHGCSGGWPEYALNYIKTKGGICTADAYPYKSGSTQQTGSCQASCSRQPIQISQGVSVRPSESAFVSALDKQPMAVVVAAGNNVWKQYKGGLVSSCPSNQLDHAVLAVGYGDMSGGSHFKIKNSWGTSWGDKGYIYLKRGACGVLQESGVYPTL